MGTELDGLTLIPAPDEPADAGKFIPLSGRGRGAGAAAFSRMGGVFGRGFGRLERKGMGGISAGPILDVLGALGTPALTAIGGAAVAWLGGRAGRKVRLKVGDVEAEARTVAELEQMMTLARKLKNDPPAGGP